MNRRHPSTTLLAASLVALAGCSDAGGYPSLAPRAIELPPAVTDAPAKAAAPADAALDAQVAAIAAGAATAAAAFGREATAACATIVAGGAAAEGSEAWIAGQQALSGLEAARAPVARATAELDALLIERGTGTASAADLDRLAAAQAEVSAIDAAAAARIAEIAGGRCPG